MIALLVALMAPPAWSDEAADRTLGTHRFVLPASVDTPFLTSRFGLRQGAGYLHIPRARFEGWRSRVDLHLAGVVQTFEGEAVIGRRASLQAQVSGELVSGVSPDSAFFLGTRAGYAWEAGGRFLLWRSEVHASQLATRVHLRGRSGYALSPSSLVEAVLDEREETLGDVLRGDILKHVLAREGSGGAGLTTAFAHALGAQTGLQAAATVRTGRVQRSWFEGEEEVSETRHRWSGAFGLALCHSFQPAAPLSVQLELRQRLDAEGWGGEDVEARLANRRFLGLGVYFTGRDELQLGLTTSAMLQSAQAERELFLTGEWLIRYYF